MASWNKLQGRNYAVVIVNYIHLIFGFDNFTPTTNGLPNSNRKLTRKVFSFA